MKIAQVLRGVGNSTGGVETGVVEISKRLLEKGQEVLIYGSPLKRHISIDKIQGVLVQKMIPYPPFFLEKNLDLIHWHQEEFFFLFVKKAAKQKKIPYIATIHMSHLGFERYIYIRKKYPMLTPAEWMRYWSESIHYHFYKNASALLCVNKEVEMITQKLFPKQKILYFPNGVDTKRFSNGNGEQFRKKHDIPLNAKVILCIGRISESKNQLLLVKAFSKIKKVHPEAYLLLIGPIKDLSYKEKLTREVLESGIQESFSLLPAISSNDPDLVDAYHACDVFALPSKNEAFGMVILEAWSTGKPVIASHIGGIPELIHHEQNGLLFESENEQDFIQKILLLWSEEKLSEKLRVAGQTIARSDYDWDLITDRLVMIYKEVIKEHQAK